MLQTYPPTRHFFLSNRGTIADLQVIVGPVTDGSRICGSDSYTIWGGPPGEKEYESTDINLSGISRALEQDHVK
jgi:hypothetical protein